MDTGPISSATAMDSNQHTTSFSAARKPVPTSSTVSTDPSTSPPPVAPAPSLSYNPSVSIAGIVSTAQSAFHNVAGTDMSLIPASVPTTTIMVTSMVSSPWLTRSIHMTIPTTTITLPTAAKPYATANSQHKVSYQKQHKKQIIGGAVGGAVAVLLVMGLLLWLFLCLRRNWMRCKKRCRIYKLRRTDSKDSKGSGDSKHAESCLKITPKKVGFKGMRLPSCCRTRITEGDDFIQELETHDPTGAPRVSHTPHRRPARYVSFFGHSGNQDFQTPDTWPGTAIKAQESRHEKRFSRHNTLKVSNPDPSAAMPSDSGSSASEEAAAAPGFVAGPEYDAGDPDAIHTLSNEASAGTTSVLSLDSDWATKDSEFQPSPPKRKSLSPLKPAVLSKSGSRPKPKKSILKKRRKNSPDLPVESESESKENEEASDASSSGEGPSKPPTDNLKFSFEGLPSGESRLGFPQTVSSTADIGMLELKDLTSPGRETSPIPSRTPKESPDPTQTLKDSIDHRAEMRKRKSALHSEARWDGIGDTERQTGHQQDCTENPSPSKQAEGPSQRIEMEDTGQEDQSYRGRESSEE